MRVSARALRQAVNKFEQAAGAFTAQLALAGFRTMEGPYATLVSVGRRRNAWINYVGGKLQYTPCESTRRRMPDWKNWFNPAGEDLTGHADVICLYAAMESTFLSCYSRLNRAAMRDLLRQIWATGKVEGLTLVPDVSPAIARTQFGYKPVDTDIRETEIII